MHRRAAGLIVALTGVALGACAPPSGESGTSGATGTTGGTGTTSGGATTWGGCEISELARGLATDAAVDCGSAQWAPFGNAWDAGAFEYSVTCALSSQDAGQPFTLLIYESGIDTGEIIAYVESPDGRFHILTQDWGVPSGRSNVCAVVCPGFVAAAVPFSVLPEDAGPLGLGCSAPASAPPTVLCMGDLNVCGS